MKNAAKQDVEKRGHDACLETLKKRRERPRPAPDTIRSRREETDTYGMYGEHRSAEIAAQ